MTSENERWRAANLAPLAALSFLFGLLFGSSFGFPVVLITCLAASFIAGLAVLLSRSTSLKSMLTVILVFSLLGVFRSHLMAGQINFQSHIEPNGYIGKLTNEDEPDELPPFIFLEKIRGYIRDNLNSSLSSEKSAYMRATLLGDEVKLGDEIEFSFKDCGLLHLIAISGQHLSIIFGGISLAMNILPARKVYKLIFAIFLVIAYSFLTDLGPSILRSLIMAIFLYSGLIVGRKASSFNALCISFLLVTGYDPQVLYDVGFQLSYLSTSSILLFSPFLREVLDFMPAALGEIIGASIAAQIGIVPVLALRFGYLSVVFLLANLLAAPIIPLILISGLIFAVVPLRAFALVLDGSLNLLFAVARIFYKNPISSISVTRPNVVWVICYIAFAASLFLLFKRFCTKKVFRTIYLLTLSFYLIFIVVFPFVLIKAGAPQVAFFDVGQGDSSLIATSKGKKVLIDCGPDGANVCSFLAAHCIRRIDLLILTHLHDDHTGGALRICDKFEVERIVIPKFLADSPELSTLKSKLKVGEARFRYVASGDEIVLDDGTKIMMYWPGEVIKGADIDANRYSLIFLADIEGSKVLYLSDSDKDAIDLALSKLIDDLAGDELDVVKVAHHGDIRALNKRLFLMAEPHSAVISVGEKNRFGHPSSELLEFLEKDGIKYFRTDLDGIIRFKIHDGTLSLAN